MKSDISLSECKFYFGMFVSTFLEKSFISELFTVFFPQVFSVRYFIC